MSGEAELVEAAIDASERQCATGDRWPRRPVRVGGGGFGAYMQLRWSQPLDLAGLNLRGYRPPVGPVLDAYDTAALLVTLARSADGSSLDLWLEPIADAVSGAMLGFTQLAPSTTYGVRDRDGVRRGSFESDAAGTARFVLDHVAAPTKLVVEVTK